jgi:hypothetical protein
MARYDADTTTMAHPARRPGGRAGDLREARARRHVQPDDRHGSSRMSAAQAMGMAGAIIGADTVEAIKAEVDALV